MNALLLLTALALTPPLPPRPFRGPSPTENDFYWRRDAKSRSGGDYTAVSFGEGMTRPEMISGESPQYTKEALENRIEGIIIVKCHLPVDGSVHDCRVIKGLPYLNDVAVRALETRKYTPAKVEGKPVEIDYLFNLKFKLPESAEAGPLPKPAASAPAAEPNEPVHGVPFCNLELRTSFQCEVVGALLTFLGLVMLVLQRTPLWKLVPLSDAWRKTPALSTLFALAFAGFAAVWTLSTWLVS